MREVEKLGKNLLATEYLRAGRGGLVIENACCSFGGSSSIPGAHLRWLITTWNSSSRAPDAAFWAQQTTDTHF